MAEPEPLLLLPGLMCDAASWAPQIAAFGAERAVVVADYAEAPTLSDMAQAALRAMAAPRFAVAGHSMGARVALELAAIAPARVSRVALLDTGTDPEQPGERDRRLALLAFGASHGMAALVMRWLPPMLAPGADPDGPLMRRLACMAERAGLAGAQRQIHALLGRRDAAPLVAALRCPVLVGVGELDAWSPPAQHQRIAALAPVATLVVYPGAGHFAPVEAPDAVIASMRDWLVSPAP